ncbi:tetratricopeptide repeat protein [Streptomyces melanogenes]|uniref:tetratricopeptide repeat protein n=1 Tax=Streptomyces melanogenes TaxID=67326 RepID=UPI0037A22E85
MPAAWPHQVGVIPSRAQSFQHRGEADGLQETVDSNGTAVLRQVLTGMGGVGKTQLAADYAHTAWDTGGLDVLVWVTASAQSPVVTGYAQAGVELCRADPDDPAQAARSFLAWLTSKAGQRPCRWLIVLDDVADPADLVVNPGDPANRFSLWPPASPYGRTLVTTRRRDATLTGEGRRLVEVGLFTEAEAVAYLTTSLAAHSRIEPADQLTALGRELGYLPLALSQAAAYLIDVGETAAAYRELLADRAITLADLAPDARPDEQAAAVAAAWSLSIDRADTLRPAGLARPMLHLAALLDANGIPQDVLTGEVARAHLAAHRTATGPNPTAEPVPVSRPDAVRALRALDRLSLIDHRLGTSHHAVRVHPLIQRAARETLTRDQRDQYARTAADVLMAAWPEIERDTGLAQALRANTDALTRHAEDALYQDTGVHPLLFRAGASLGDTDQVDAAVRHFQRMVDATRDRLGRDHPDCLESLHCLAFWQGETRDQAGAAATYRELLADYERLLGLDHPDTLSARVGVLFCRTDKAGNWADALAEASQLLADHERILGLDHAATLNVRNVIAHFQGQAGDAAGAAAAFEPLLHDFQRVVGPDDSYTLSIQRQLVLWRGMAGNPADAAAAFEPLLQTMLRTLGADHPQVRMTLNHLAYFRGKAGDAASAAIAYEELAASCERVLGPDHAPGDQSNRGWR